MRIFAINTIKIKNTNQKQVDLRPVRQTNQKQICNLSFGGIIPPAKRLQKSDYLISGYITEISKARNFHGDRAVVDLSMGNPDLTPPERAKQILKAKVNDLWSHRYNSPKGEGALFHTVAQWMENRFGVSINPRTEVMATSGSSDAVDHIFSAFANIGDKVLVPNPGYSLYDDLITRHDLKKETFDLKPENNYLPDFNKLPKDAKILILNYPHNPTGSFAPIEVFENAVKWARENNVLIIHDMDNSEITHYGNKPIGIMQVEGAKDLAFQVHTFSKAQSMPGLRVAFTVSDSENINYLLKAKYLSGGSVYVPVQHAAVEALKDEEGYINKVNSIYRNRKNITIDRLNKLGSDAKPTNGTYYLWAKIPPEFTSDEFFKYVLHKAHVAFTPGTVFGTNGEGFIRIVMSAKDDVIKNCFDKIEKAGIRFDTPKSKLPIEIQDEIKMMADGSFWMESKADRDFKEYRQELEKRYNNLTKVFKNKDDIYNKFLPSLEAVLPWNILKDGQSVYLQNIQEGLPAFGEMNDIHPFSNSSVYKKLANTIKKQWLKSETSSTEILPPYRSGTFYQDAYYFTLKTDDNKLQAIANVEIQKDGELWIRSLNTAPTNQGSNSLYRGCGKAIMARIVSFCLETGNDTIKLATNKPENIRFYKNLGMVEDGTRNFNGEINTVLKFDKKSMELFLNKFQVNLSF